MNPIDLVTQMMAGTTTEDGYRIQRHQTAHRFDITNAWAIKPGERILEIGSGQGDLSAVLAYQVGEHGHVTAIDIAPRDYGAPIPIGQAFDHLLDGPLGSRLSVYFQMDLTKALGPLANQHFDRIVFAHSLWYFSGVAAFSKLLAAVRPLAPQVDLAEWSLQPTATDQVGHLEAALIQGLLYAIVPSRIANIRTLITEATLRSITKENGWQYTAGTQLFGTDLEDATWEIATTNAMLREVPLDSTLRSRLLLMVDSMNHNGSAALPTFTGTIIF